MPAGTAITLPMQRSEVKRARRLATMRRRATGMLVGVAVAYAVVLVFTDGDGWSGWAQAMAEASLVGGLADWFAVTALFRHPLGIPIPHTAVIPQRKDQFGQTLGEFVQRSFLTPEIIVERVRGADPVGRGARWLADPGNADRVAGHVVDAAVAIADVVKDDDVHRLIGQTIQTRLDAVPLTPTVAKVLRLMTNEGRHHELLDSLLRGFDGFLDESRSDLRARFEKEAPRWIPGAVEDRIFERLLDGVRAAVRDVVTDPDHELRRRFDERVLALVEELETSPELRARGEELKRELLEHPQLRDWTSDLWRDIKAQLRIQADDPSSELRQHIADTVRAIGQRLLEDPVLARKIANGTESSARYIAEHFSDEIASIVSTTIERWDASETALRLELLLGPDLQFIRINGTVVGGLAGLLIYAISQLT